MNKTQRCCILSFCISLLHIFFPIPANATPVLEYKNFTAEGTERAAQLPTLKFSAPVLAKTDKSTKDSSTSKKNSKTSSTDAQILAEIEKGTPASLRSAVSRVKQLGTKATDYENILFYVADALYSIVFPNERVSWEPPKTTKDSVYVSAIESAKSGAYAFGAAKDGDFLTLVLPSLILLTAPTVNNYYPESENALLQAVNINGQSLIARYLLGILFEREGKNDRALEQYEAAFKLQSDSIVIAEPYIKSLLKFDRAKDAYNTAVKVHLKNPNNLVVIKLCAESAFAMKEWTLAEPYINQVLQADSSDGKFLMMRARIFLEEGEYLKAATSFDSATKNVEQNENYYILRSRILRDWNKNESAAIQTINEGLTKFPENADLTLLAADLAFSTGTKIANQSASQLASRILEKDGTNEDAHKILIQEAIKNKQWQTACDRADKLLAITKDNTARILKTEACLGAGRKTEARDTALVLYKTNPEDEEIQKLYIKVLIATGNTTEAASLIEKILPDASQKTKSDLYYFKSLLAKDSAVRLNDLRSSLTNNPRNQDALFDLYRYYYDKNDYRKAQYYLKQVIALNPTNPEYKKLQEQLQKLLAQ
ncbi:MAG: tetratricopeptide repeat protein [Spirochaetaceae bacterium]|nr:tetratricopeptide repeat protein [Spirochaetaceae bacterium]